MSHNYLRHNNWLWRLHLTSSSWVHGHPDVQKLITYLENLLSILLVSEMTSDLGRKDYLPILNIYFPETQLFQQLWQRILLFWSVRGAALPPVWPIPSFLLPPQFVPLMGRSISTLPVTAAQQTVMFRSRFWKQFMQITCQPVVFSRSEH